MTTLWLTGEGIAAIGNICFRSSCDYVELSVIVRSRREGEVAARTNWAGADRSWQKFSVSIAPNHDHDSITSFVTDGLFARLDS
jgi:hypothetical protein